ncbi:MAG: pyridoxal-phosphate dependent enzyme [Gemmatimonadetes bacterium]|jgi:threonine dehydratase|nr:pyridoxal-phosphate dependent enzyme [Gemmatimonadota bacterium]
MERPAFEDIVSARDFIRPHLPPTPLLHCPGLSELLNCDYYVKCENCQPVGAFKIRGGVNLVGRLTAEEKRAGVIGASTGNHGQSLAFAGRLFGVRVIIYGPERNANPAKVQGMRDLGAEVRLHGADFDAAREEVERVVEREGYRYVHSANEPLLIAGVGSMGLEIFDELPEVEVIIAPVGGGSGVCGSALVAKRLNPQVEMIGVQSERAPAAWQAWRERSLEIEADMQTEHEGLATRVPFALTMEIMWELLDDFALVGDGEIEEGIRLLARHGRQIAEGAGAAALAGAVKLRERLQGKKVVGILSGGNLAPDRYAGILTGNS